MKVATYSDGMEESLGQRVRRLRRAKNLSQKQLGEKVGRSEGWVSKLEHGTIQDPAHTVMTALAMALDVHSSELLDEDEFVSNYFAPMALATRFENAIEIDSDFVHRLAEFGEKVLVLAREFDALQAALVRRGYSKPTPSLLGDDDEEEDPERYRDDGWFPPTKVEQ